MNELVFRGESGEPMTTSHLVADAFGKRHEHVVRDIETTIKYIQSVDTQNTPNLGNCETMFLQQIAEVPAYNGAIRKTKSYIMTRDGFTLLAMGYSGKKAMEFKLKYIAAFNTMERMIRENSQSLQNQPTTQPIVSADVSDLRERVERLEKLLASGAEPKRIPVPADSENEYPWHSIISSYRNLREMYPTYITVIQAAEELRRRDIPIRQTSLYRYLRGTGCISAQDKTYNRPSAECVKNGWMVCMTSRKVAGYPGRNFFTPYLSPEFVDILERQLALRRSRTLELWKEVAE